jgi:transposase
LGVARATVNRWVQRDRARGEPALAALKQGRLPHPSLERAQVAQLTQLIRDYSPEQLQLPYPLWTLEAVAALIRQQCGQQLSRQAVSNYLRAWGLSPQKPAKRAREQCPEAVRRKTFLIVDRHPVHRAHQVQQWVA